MHSRGGATLAKSACGLAMGVAALVATSHASADPAYVTRRLTLSQGEFGVDVGVGLADDARDDVTGTGAYAQVGYGITNRIEISVRDGARFGLYGRYSHAEQYGRLYTTEGVVTPATSTFANPDITVLGRFLDLGFLELAGELEISAPFASGTHVATTEGVIAVLHYAPFVRFDTGFYVTETFLSPTEVEYDIPLELWFQPTHVPFWFGPLSGLHTVEASHQWRVPLGVGAGYALTSDIDLRAEWLVPELNVTPGIRDMGFGVGGQVRF